MPLEDTLFSFNDAPCNAAQGSRILFFSGGTALSTLSQKLIHYTHNSIHCITPFDSGGSSAVLRRAFAMPAVGDIRSRITALADTSIEGVGALATLMNYRLPSCAPYLELFTELQSVALGEHPLCNALSNTQCALVCRYAAAFLRAMPTDFDLRGACVGNVLLAAGYLHHNRHLSPIISEFSHALQTRGLVCAVANSNLQLAVELEDKSCICGQHAFTGKFSAPISSPISRLFLYDSNTNEAACRTCDTVLAHIASAELICYPIGSFYSSVLANLLPQGIGAAISQASCPKIFVPNSLPDPESFHKDVGAQVKDLLATLRRDAEAQLSASVLCSNGAQASSNAQASVGAAPVRDTDLLNYIVLDAHQSERTSPRAGILRPEDEAELIARGIQILRLPLSNRSVHAKRSRHSTGCSGAPDAVNADALVQCLLQLAQ